MCVIISDFNTTVEALPAWKNRSCIGTLHAEHFVYYDQMEYNVTTMGSNRSLEALSSREVEFALSPWPCPTEPLGPRAASRYLRPHLPLHISIDGQSDKGALQRVIGLFDGDALAIDGLAYVNASGVKFSRAGAIEAGLSVITTPPKDSLVFVSDTDMIIRPGFFEELLHRTRVGVSVFYPITWSMCYGASLESLPDPYAASELATKHTSQDAGFWRDFGWGMIGAYLSDLQAVGGLK
jgi:hypothetical protein